MYPQVLPPVAPPLRIAKSLPDGQDLPFGGGYFFAASSLLTIFGSFAFRVSCAHELASGPKAKQPTTNAATNREYVFIYNIVTIPMPQTDGAFFSFKKT